MPPIYLPSNFNVSLFTFSPIIIVTCVHVCLGTAAYKYNLAKSNFVVWYLCGLKAYHSALDSHLATELLNLEKADQNQNVGFGQPKFAIMFELGIFQIHDIMLNNV